MGSLMGGWDSPYTDPKVVTYQRNKSFTNGEIEAYWRSKKRTEEEHLKAISGSPELNQESTYKESGRNQRSISLPVTDLRNFKTVEAEATSPDKLKKDWWTRSNLAFLNEPPVVNTEGTTHKYKAQYHVTSFSSLKT